MPDSAVRGGDERECGWIASLPSEAAPPRRLLATERADCAVVGAGLTGLAVARRLAELEPGWRILLLDAGRAGAGASGRSSGFVVDLKQLKEVMHREVLDAMDHRFLNKEVPEFRDQIPTAENIAIAIWHRLVTKLDRAQLHRVRVYETPDLFVDFYGEP